jgi:uncharacterized protein
MLSFDIRQTSSKAARVEGALAADDAVWEEEDVRPAEPLQVEARLSPAGAGRFYLNGRMTGSAEMECRRCLTSVRVNVNEEFQALFAPEGDEEADDPDVFMYDPNAWELDLRPALRELWLIAVPRYVVCDEACRGLCPSCGRNLNEGPCDCPPVRDSRWDALRPPAPSRN